MNLYVLWAGGRKSGIRLDFSPGIAGSGSLCTRLALFFGASVERETKL